MRFHTPHPNIVAEAGVADVRLSKRDTEETGGSVSQWQSQRMERAGQ